MCELKFVSSKIFGYFNVTVKVTFLYGCFSWFLNCANGSKLRNASHIAHKLTLNIQEQSVPLQLFN